MSGAPPQRKLSINKNAPDREGSPPGAMVLFGSWYALVKLIGAADDIAEDCAIHLICLSFGNLPPHVQQLEAQH